mmetsp:Transcript_11657/g.17670  ORF Transcript_11657/g.17670 Transcript_11657/m.17670 type:complete len:283 (+) Transcript_11657:122-970(+)
MNPIVAARTSSFSLETVDGHAKLLTAINLSDSIIIVGFGTFLVTFVLFFALHIHRMEHEWGALQIPTISLTGSYLPESIIFTLGLHIMAFLLLLAYSGLYIVYDQNIRKGQFQSFTCDTSSIQRKLLYWNRFLWRVGACSCIFLAVTGSIPLTLNSFLHGTVAFFMFLSQILHLVLFHYKLAKPLVTDHRVLLLQRVAIFLSLPFVISVYIIAGVVLMMCSEYRCRSFVVNVHVALEYVVTIALAAYVHSWRNDLSRMSWAAMLDASISNGPILLTHGSDHA